MSPKYPLDFIIKSEVSSRLNVPRDGRRPVLVSKLKL